MVKSCRIRGRKHDDGRTGPTVVTPSSAETERTAIGRRRLDDDAWTRSRGTEVFFKTFSFPSFLALPADLVPTSLPIARAIY